MLSSTGSHVGLESGVRQRSHAASGSQMVVSMSSLDAKLKQRRIALTEHFVGTPEIDSRRSSFLYSRLKP
jgi:hypothetical protein